MSSVPFQLHARVERWPIAGRFSISRGSKTEAVVVVAKVHRGGLTGRGECVPYPRYNETPEAAIDTIRGKFGNRAVELGLVFDRGARPKR